MKISELFKQKVVYSFEIFPQKVNDDISKIYKTLSELKDVSPDYISITYSAGGSKNSRTKEIAQIVKDEYGIEPLAHLTCINSTKQEVANALQGLVDIGVQNVLALRGDRIGAKSRATSIRKPVDGIYQAKQRYGRRGRLLSGGTSRKRKYGRRYTKS